MRITKLKITNYRGIAALDTHIDEGATVARGRNAAGKTTVLASIRAALAGADIGADAIRHGAEDAEILVDLDNLSVRRAISKKGSSLTVTRDGFRAPKPQAFLSDLLGMSPLDPLDLMLLKPKDRRARILEALPCTVTREQLLTWAPELPPSFPTEGHGLEVVEAARKLFYDRRAAANLKAKESRATADRATSELGGVTAPPLAMSVQDATAALDAAKREEQRLTVRADEARTQEARNVTARELVEEKRQRAVAFDVEAKDVADTGEIVAGIGAAERECEDLEERLAAARKKLAGLEHLLASAQKANDAAGRAKEQAAAHRKAADELEASLLAAGVAAPTEDELALAASSVQQARATLAQAKGAEVLGRQVQEAARLGDIAREDAAGAAALDTVVQALSNDAPRALLAASDAIPGLTLDGDEVVLDGKRLDALCGAEQMRLCVEIAKRSNAKARFLVVDGLERLDEDQLRAFVAEATRDGWQLVGTRVDRGDLVLEHLDAEPEDVAAQ